MTIPRPLVILGLIATLSGPFLRGAEGADDLARSLAELGQPPLMEEVDGGVGDDSGAAVVADLGQRPFGLQAPGLIGPPNVDDGVLLISLSLPLSASSSPVAGPFLWPGRAGLRLAWTQRFLL